MDQNHSPQTSDWLVPGTYKVTEDAMLGCQKSIACTDQDNNDEDPDVIPTLAG